MIAVTKTASGEVALTDRPVPKLGAGQVRLRVCATGVCGTDLHIASDEYPSEPPVTMGHEISGVVVEVELDGDQSLLGKRVVCETYFSTCEVCQMCRAGRRNLCASRRSLGSFVDGGFAATVVVPALNLHVVPEHVTSEDAVLFEPLACVAQCLLNPSRIVAGDRVLVIGPGTMGLLAVQVALAAGARVTCLGLASDKRRLAIAEQLGAASATETELETYDVVIECSGSPAAMSTAFRAARRGARFVQVGISGREVTIPFDSILYKELEVSSGFASTPQSWRRALELVESQQVDLAGLVTHALPLDRWEDAFALVGSADAIKVALVP